MQLLKKILLYLSAFIPLYFLLLIKITVQIINKNLNLNVLNSMLISLLCLLCGLGTLGIFFAMFSNQKSSKIVVLNFSNITEKHFLGYFSLFVLFALSYEIEYFCMAIIFVLILIFIGIVYIKNNLFYINPLLNIIGFSFYNVEYTAGTTSSTKTAIFAYYGKLEANKSYLANISPFNFNIINKK